MKRYTLLIKGLPGVAHLAAIEHKAKDCFIPVDNRDKISDTIIYATMESDDVYSWFGEEPLNPPFNDGALLWFNG